ncbi:MAG: hypothetical protein Q8K98_10500 [Bacteroidota bacterium]|nr:hypothetical protein [Bacteroidota bacterium]
MKIIILSIKLLFFTYLGYLFYFLIDGYDPTSVSYRPPFAIFVLDIINLFVHEAGHFFFQIFGRWIYFLGGSLLQVLLPLALVIVTWRQNVRNVSYAVFWLGQSLINVSVYIQDAPFRKLRLIAKGLIHDWNWLLSNNLELAEPIGLAIYFIGLFICFAGIVSGIIFAILSYRDYTDKIEFED